jgi:uncharacterized protein
MVFYAEKSAKDYGIAVVFSITTNGSLISDKIANFFSEHKFRVSVSLDGPADVNDSSRIYGNMAGTYDDITSGIARLNKAGVGITVLTTISDCNLDRLDNKFVDLLVDSGVSNWGLNVDDMTSSLHMKTGEVIERLLSLARYALNRGLNTAGMWYKPIYAMTNRKLSYCSAADGSFLSVETDGTIYPCSRVNRRLGHIEDFIGILRSDNYLDIGTNIVGNIAHCIGCELEAMCMGGCLAIKSDKVSGCNGCGLTGRNEFACDFIKRITLAILSDPTLPMID